MIMSKKDLEKTFYLIAKYWLGRLEGFIRIGDNKEEITKFFEEKYMWKKNTLGVTEESYQLLECTATEIINDKEVLERLKGNE